MKQWTSEEKQELTIRFSHEDAETIGKKLGKTKCAVKNMAKRLGLVKSEEYEVEMWSRTRNGRGGKKTATGCLYTTGTGVIHLLAE